MTTSEINQGISLLCQTSKEIAQYYQDHEKLVSALNNVSEEHLNRCMEYYTGRSGVIVDLRKEVILYLQEGNQLTVERLEAFINQHKAGKENQFRSYKKWFSIFYPPITFYGHNEIRKFTEELITQLISDLDIQNEVKSIWFDFQGARMQGSDRFWLAIYNAKNESHSSELQFFIEFIEGKIGYGVYRHQDKQYLSKKMVLSPTDFNYEQLLTYFKPNVKLLLDDVATTVSEPSEIIAVRNNRSVFPSNTIFYGPPGTGKTYKTILRAAEILTPAPIANYSAAQEIFQNNLGDKIEFITFHQNYSYEDFIQGLRPDVENNSNLTFERRDGLFTKIATNALFEYYKIYKTQQKRTNPKEENLEDDLNEIYLDFVEHLREMETKEFSSASGSTISISTFTKNNNIEFKHKNSSRSYVVSAKRLLKLYEIFPDIDLVKNVHNDIRDAIGGCNTTVYWVALKAFIDFKKGYQKEELSEVDESYDEVAYETKKKLLASIDYNLLAQINSEDVPNYVIIIDEINRANISRVFGELITLIEPDKRSHGKNPLRCTLPSGEEFIVPSNLYLIGTMNTADKSIALLDIALRRRFEFEAMYPKYEIEEHIVHDKEILESMNKEIITKKGHDFQIGHSFFMGDDYELINRMNKKVIPLLLEYFMNDDDEVKEILKKAKLAINNQAWPLKITGKQTND